MIKTKYTLLLLVLFSLTSILTQDTQEIEWTLGVTYPPMDLDIGDKLVWKYNDPHNVYKFVDKEHYDNCNFEGATEIAASVGGGTGNLENLFEMSINGPSGTEYYGCSVPSHCDSGMKIQINVGEATIEETSDVPLETTTVPVETDVPVETTEEPVDTTEEPVETTDVPVNTTEEPVDTTEEPVETTDVPIESTYETLPGESTEHGETCHHDGTCIEDTYPSASALGEDQINSSCVYGTYLFNGYCACWSGAYGKDCKMGPNVYCEKIIASFWTLQSDTMTNCYPGGELDTINNNRDFCMDFVGHSSCSSYSSWGSVLPLETLNPPRMDSASFEMNKLKIIVSQPMVNGRADGAAFLNNNKLNQTSPYCVYPVSDYIFKEVEGCRDIWRFEIPWNLASQCGWDIKYQEGYKIYKGQVIIHNHEYTENIQDCRFIQSVLRIQLRFQLFVQVTLSSVVYNQPNLNSAITQQIVAVSLEEDACLQLTTTINYPYRLENGALIYYPPEKFLSHTFTSTIEECSTSGVSECRQRWKSCLSLSNETCDLNGLYRMNFTKECRSSELECPLLESDKPTTIEFNLVSENFCAEILIDIGLYGSIQIYEDETFTTLRSSFILGNRACFLVTVNSESNPSPYNISSAAILLTNTKLWTVTVRVGSEDIVKLWDKGLLLSNGLNTEIKEIDMEEGNKVGFCFVFSKELILTLNCTGVVNLITGAEVQVYYEEEEISGKRDHNAGHDKTTLTATNSLDTTREDNGNYGSIVLVSIVLMLLSLFI